MKNKIVISLFALIICLCSCSEDDIPFEGKDNYISFFQLEKDGTQYKGLITDNKINIEVAENIDLTNAKVEYAISELSTITPDPKTITDWEKPVEFTVSSYNEEEKTYLFSIIKKEVVNQGDIELLSQADVDAFASTGATKIDGNLIIGKVENLEVLNKITEVSKSIIIQDSCSLENFDALTNLTKAGNIYFGTIDSPFAPKQDLNINFKSLVDVGEILVNTAKIKTVAFPSLKNAYSITINSNSVDTIVFSSLDNVFGNISIQSERNTSIEGPNKALTNIKLNTLTTVLGSITFNQLHSTEQIDLSKLTTVGGSLSVSDLIVANNIKLDALTSVDNALKFIRLDGLVRLSLPKLTQAGSFEVEGAWGAAALEEINLPELTLVNNILSLTRVNTQALAFPKLATVGEALKLSNVEPVTSIDISNLTSCKTMDIDGIEKITSLDLSNISNLEAVTIIGAYVLEDLTLPQTIRELTLNGGSMATNFPELKGIETVSDKFEISNYSLSEITVGSVKEIGTFSETYASGQTGLEFTSLESIGELELSLTDLTSFKAPKLKRMDKLNFMNMWALSSIEFPLLTEITTEMKIKGANWAGAAANCLMSDLKAFESVTTIGSIDISYCGNLNDFSGLRNAISSLTEEKWKIEDCKYNPTYQNMVDGDYVGE
ncbi:MAG: hypothetical protein ACEPOZ_09890 [Marinifilaceae bacterium]